MKKLLFVSMILLITSSWLLCQITLTVPNSYPTLDSAVSYANQIAVQGTSVTIVVNPNTPDVISGGFWLEPNINLTITPGTCLTWKGATIQGELITDSAKLYFNGGSLWCYGKATCKHTTFTGLDWGGIRVHAADSALFKYCTINNFNAFAVYGLEFLVSVGSEVSYCTISNASNISGVSGTCLHGWNSTLYIYKNNIHNSEVGVTAGGSTVFFGKPGVSLGCDSGNNTITGHRMYGIMAGSRTVFHLDTSRNANFNNISGNGSYDAGVQIDGVIHAEENYWGSNPKFLFGSDPSSRLDIGNPLTCMPLSAVKMGVIEEENSNIADIPNLKKIVSNDISSDIEEELKRAIAFVFSEEYNKAIDVYKSILSVTKDAPYVIQSLNSLIHIYRVTRDKELLEYLKGYSRSEATALPKMIYADALIVGGYVDEALSEYNTVAKNYSNTYYEVQALMEESFIYYIYKNDIKRAKEIIKVLEKIAQDDYDVIRLKARIERAAIEEIGKRYFEDEGLKETEVKIEGYSLGNYPNPFNPTTTIQYSIPKDEFVKLTVYDITGRVVKELVNGHKTAGKYSVEFNASSYSSGTYYYKIEAGEYKNIQKMVLIK